jgi:low temperature requirement protein LtrA
MGESDNAHRESTEITADKKTRSARLFLVVIALVVIVAGVLWLSGLLSPDKFRKTAQVVLEKKSPSYTRKRSHNP